VAYSISERVNLIFIFLYLDENWACRAAIEQSRNIVNGLIGDDLDKHHWLHQWSYSTCKKY